MSAIKNLTGNKFGVLIVMQESGRTKSGRVIWKCLCDCGNETDVNAGNLLSGSIKSCGCAKLKQGGISGTKTGISWNSMINRCYNKNFTSYPAYGAVGIFVCEFLRASPVNLILSIGERPTEKSLDRKNNSGHYTCGNCKECFDKNQPKNIQWSSRIEQNRNQSSNNLISFNGRIKCLSEWASILGINRSTLSNRFRSGWRGQKLFSK